MSWLTNIVRMLSPNCKSAIRLQSEALDRKLPLLRRTGLRLHLWLCIWCSRYGKQIKILRAAAQNCDDRELGQTLPAEARARIKRTLATGRKD
jgi:hypothetical protein